jgi:hypothetical protein
MQTLQVDRPCVFFEVMSLQHVPAEAVTDASA